MRAPYFALGLCVASVTPLAAQTPLRSAPSTRATAEVTLAPPRVQGQPAPAASKIRIAYGQPHARGRSVVGALEADRDTVWRLGANDATTLTTDVDLTLGGVTVPKGSYSLYARTSSRGAWQLIINQNTGQWGTEYVKDKDLARVPLTAQTLATPIESFSMWLVPAADGAPSGDLRFAWGTRAFSTTWSVK
jgi:hypothetical protein